MLAAASPAPLLASVPAPPASAAASALVTPFAFSALWYRPHDECGWEGSNATNAAMFVNDHMTTKDGVTGVDFLGISGYGDNDRNPIGGNGYGSVASVCGNPDDLTVVSPIVLFYNEDRWDAVDLYPSSDHCRDTVPTAFPGQQNDGRFDCGAQTVPFRSDCCSCTYSDEELATDPKIVQRPWAAGLFRQKQVQRQLGTTSNSDDDENGGSSGRSVCVVVASLAHPGNTTESFGVISPAVKKFCGDNSPVVFMADTNLNEPGTPTSKGFDEEPLASLEDYSSQRGGGGDHHHLPYTCCNDTYRDATVNQFASDRIAVSSGLLSIDDLFGGSTAPGREMPAGFGYQCHNMKEHAPLLARVSFKH